MKTRAWTLAAAVLAMTSSPARVQACDYREGIPYAAVANWCGYYFGANLGFAHTGVDVSVSTFGFPFPFAVEGSGSDTKLTGGFLAGYNWQYGNQVYGIEGGINFLSDFDFLASIRGRYGVIYNDWLYYGTAGVSFIDSGASISAPGLQFDGFSSAGFVVGGGAETKLNGHLSAGLEGLFYFFPEDSQNVGFGATVRTNVDVFSVRARLSYKFD